MHRLNVPGAAPPVPLIDARQKILLIQCGGSAREPHQMQRGIAASDAAGICPDLILPHGR